MARDESGRFTKAQFPVPATVVDVADGAKPIPANVVEDSTDKLGKRLAFIGLALLLIFFAASAYIQSARNSQALEDAQKQRQEVIDSLARLSTAFEAQTTLTKQLQEAIRRQNQALENAGIEQVPVPGAFPLPTDPMGDVNPAGPLAPSNDVQANPDRVPNEPEEPEQGPPGPPGPQGPPGEPAPSPTPEPEGPLSPVQDTVCTLIGICT